MTTTINADDGVISGSAGLKSTPDSSGELALQTNGVTKANITPAGLFQFDSGYGSVATAYGCRAWVNFNGQGTISIRASRNISSISDNAVGNYSVFFITNMPDANYSLPAACFHNSGISSGGGVAYANIATNAFQILTAYNTGITFDPQIVTAAVFR